MQIIVEHIRDMARIMKGYAFSLERLADKMEKEQDITYSSEALNAVSNCVMNLRMDLLSSRTIRVLQREKEK